MFAEGDVYKGLFCFQFFYMTAAWILCITLNNGSFVDIAWPSGFFIMAVQFLISGEGNIYFKV